MPRKKVYKTKFFKFSKDAVFALDAHKQRTGKTEVSVVEDLLTGKDRFASDVEEWIAAEMHRTGLVRDVLIERALLAMIRKKAPRR